MPCNEGIALLAPMWNVSVAGPSGALERGPSWTGALVRLVWREGTFPVRDMGSVRTDNCMVPDARLTLSATNDH